ncbi:hypothetical protein IW140_003166 [Coemansia sp. RSA 1813]|nr:hypothetical protein IW140_003166 [Coemansia sp. RSA 1813]
MSAIPRPPDAEQEPGESSGNAVPIGSGSQSVGLSNHLSTPAANRAKAAAEDPEAYACDPATEKRREKNWLFAGLAKKAPMRLEKHLNYPKEALTEMCEAGVTDLAGKSLETSERALTKHFKWLWEQMQCIDKTRWPGVEKTSSLKYVDFQNKAVSGSKTKPDEEALQLLWFFATLRASEFGHVCEIPKKSIGIAFSKPKVDGTTNISLTLNQTGDGIAEIREKISRPVRIIRRSSYMYRVTFEGKEAVLKLTWVPVSRFPEGAAYQLLEECCKDLIPEVYASGVIEHDRFGYRLEFLVIEYCGITIDAFAQKHKSDRYKQETLEWAVCDAVKRSSECIAKAYSAGVLHWDISAGNIAIKAGKAKVIDWGYAKLRDDIAIKGIELVEKKWHFSGAEVAEEEARHDSITGTSLFMSIQVLLGASSRGLIHDMESIFYVALHSLAIFSGNMDKDKSPPLGFCVVGNSMTAAARIGCLVSRTSYLKHFGVSNCLPITTTVLNSMYNFLFYEDSQFIAGDFLEDASMQRSADTALASSFMDASLIPSVIAANPPSSITQQPQQQPPNQARRSSRCVAVATDSTSDASSAIGNTLPTRRSKRKAATASTSAATASEQEQTTKRKRSGRK